MTPVASSEYAGAYMKMTLFPGFPCTHKRRNVRGSSGIDANMISNGYIARVCTTIVGPRILPIVCTPLVV